MTDTTTTQSQQNFAGPRSVSSPEALVTKRELAKYLNFSERWIEIQVKQGMPHMRIGTRLRFRISDVERYFARRGDAE